VLLGVAVGAQRLQVGQRVGPSDRALAHVVGIDGYATAALAPSMGAVQHLLAQPTPALVVSWRRRRSARACSGQRP
jgi:hypothetical protein